MSAVLLVAALAVAAPSAELAGTVTHLEGQADVDRPDGAKRGRAIRKGQRLNVGQVVHTGPKTRLELTLVDGSVVRLGPDSKLSLDALRFAEKRRETVQLKLWVGQLWARVVKSTSGVSNFEVHTASAVGGVRGTSFAVFAAADASAIVRVYAGSVGVRPVLGEGRNRKLVAGPKEIDRAQWEEIIATAMKQVRISALGQISPAEDFEATADDWGRWNRKRDDAR
jgi:ferric-dicitrate binding protein FerR (iron transport regulator)